MFVKLQIKSPSKTSAFTTFTTFTTSLFLISEMLMQFLKLCVVFVDGFSRIFTRNYVANVAYVANVVIWKGYRSLST